MLDALVHDLGLGDFEADFAVLDCDAPWLDEDDASPPAKRRCLVGRRYDSATWLGSSSPEGEELTPTKEILNASPVNQRGSPHWSGADGMQAQSSPTQQMFSPSSASPPTATSPAEVPAFEIPVTGASDVDCDLSSLPGPLYLIPALVSGRTSLDESPSSLLVYVVSTSPAPFSGAPIPAPRPLAAQSSSSPKTALRKRPRPHNSPRTYKCYVCQKLYDSKYKLKLHMSWHSALSPLDSIV